MRPSRKFGYDECSQAAGYLRRRAAKFPRVGIVLGSGLGEVAIGMRDGTVIPFRRIPHFPHPTVKGHAGRLHLGHWDKLPVAILEGRVHLYEGYTPAEVVFAVRALGLAGVETLILTCAAGGIAPRATPGSLMLFSDHLNLQGSSPLGGTVDEGWGARFLDLSAAYDWRLRRIARQAAKALRLKCFEGVYAAVLGPNYETPAEIRALKRLGADAVGMSTVPEVIAARQLNMQVLAIATITNRAAGLAKEPLDHGEVLEAGKQASECLARLLDRVLRSLQATLR
ncbi:MAG: purine-nucleoside phosphorylase [Acidobacteria bacterium]|nr:purine-nucleoside phosphorylase [Acidobacteriota bacterium]